MGAFEAVPPVVPNVNVAVTPITLTKPPVPVQVNPVAIAILNLVVAAVVCPSTMLFDPNAIARVSV